MNKKPVITFFLADQMLATSMTLPLEQLRAAESMVRADKRKQSIPLNIRLASIDGCTVTTHTGLHLQPDCKLEEIAYSDLTFLPALWRNPSRSLKKNVAIQPWLTGQHERGGIIAGVGTGCCFMAEAGLLDNRPATTHWYYFDRFQKLYPNVKLERHRFITGQDNLYCAASVNALADLTVYFIQCIFDTYYARHVERHFFHEVRTVYDLPHSATGRIEAHPDEEIAQIQSWMRHNYGYDVSIQKLAQRFSMTLRTFNRRFKKATSRTPLEYLTDIRMFSSGELLKTSNLTVAEIAERSGYQDLSHFTALFKKHFGTTPSEYRATVRAKLFTPD